MAEPIKTKFEWDDLADPSLFGLVTTVKQSNGGLCVMMGLLLLRVIIVRLLLWIMRVITIWIKDFTTLLW